MRSLIFQMSRTVQITEICQELLPWGDVQANKHLSGTLVGGCGTFGCFGRGWNLKLLAIAFGLEAIQWNLKNQAFGA